MPLRKREIFSKRSSTLSSLSSFSGGLTSFPLEPNREVLCASLTLLLCQKFPMMMLTLSSCGSLTRGWMHEGASVDSAGCQLKL